METKTSDLENNILFDPYSVCTPVPEKTFSRIHYQRKGSVINKQQDVKRERLSPPTPNNKTETDSCNNENRDIVMNQILSVKMTKHSDSNSRLNDGNENYRNDISTDSITTNNKVSKLISYHRNEKDYRKQFSPRMNQDKFNRIDEKKSSSIVHSELSVFRNRRKSLNLQDFPSKEFIIETIMDRVKTGEVPCVVSNEPKGDSETDNIPSSRSAVTSVSNTSEPSLRNRTTLKAVPKPDQKLHRPSFDRKKGDRPIVARTILICFTSGFISSVVGIVSLKDVVNDQRPFQVFYPMGTLLMLTIVFLKFPHNSFMNHRVKYTALLTLFIIPVIITALVFKFDLSSHQHQKSSVEFSSLGSSFTLSPYVSISIFLFGLQLLVSFSYVFFCLQDIKYL
jgi:hypothetical protein